MDADQLHDSAIIVDAVSPLTADRKYIDWYKEGGVTIITPTVALVETADQTIKALASWRAYVATRDDLIQINTTADIQRAKSSGKTGIMFHFQGTDPIEDNLELIPLYGALGVKVIQLTYNRRNRVGDGGSERYDSGLSYFGLDVVAALNKAGIVVDCAHTGERTTMDAIEASTAPVVISHGNARAIHMSDRNISDTVIKAIGENNGMIGAVGFPAFVSSDARPSLDQFIDHMVYVGNMIGIDRVGLGLDYASMQWPVMDDEAARALYDHIIAAGAWRPEAYPPPPYYYPAGIETPRTLRALTQRLVERDFGETEIRGILGGNWLRLYNEVWRG